MMAHKGRLSRQMRVLQFLKRLRDSKIAHTSQSGYLERLPNELKIIVFGFLTCNDQVAVGLCSYSLLNAVGSVPLKEFHTQPRPEREELFLRLDRDLPYPWTACTRCLKVHFPPPANLEHIVDEWNDPAIRTQILKRECFHIDRIFTTGKSFAPCFRFEHIQLAMKLYRQGLDTKSFVNSLDVIHIDPYRDDHLVSFEANIRHDRFFMKRQDWIIYSHRIHSAPEEGPVLGLFGPCGHFAGGYIWNDYPERRQWFDKERRALSILSEMRKDDYWHRFPDTRMVTSDLKQCDHCATEFRLSCGLFGEQQAKYEGHYTIVLTTWMCLGEGRTPQDWYWTSYISPGLIASNEEAPNTKPQYGPVAFMFEGHKFGYQDLQPRWTDAMEKAWSQEKKWCRRDSSEVVTISRETLDPSQRGD